MHISNKTLGFLDGAFETERAYGEKREEMLRAANITTYFITNVIKPVRDYHMVLSTSGFGSQPNPNAFLFLPVRQFSGDNGEPHNGGIVEDTTQDNKDDHCNVSTPSYELIRAVEKNNNNNNTFPGIFFFNFSQDETRVLAETGREEDSEDFKKRLRKELMSRDGQK